MTSSLTYSRLQLLQKFLRLFLWLYLKWNILTLKLILTDC